MRQRPKTLFAQAAALIVFAVLFGAVFDHLDRLAHLFRFLLEVLQPLLVGGALAFFMNVPMRGFENLFARWQTKKGKPVRERPNAIIALTLTYLLAPLVLFLVFYAIIPQVVSAVPSIVASVENAWPRFLDFLQRNHVETDALEAWTNSFDLGKVLSTITNNLDTIWETSVSAVSSVVSVITIGITSIVISIYLLANKPRVMRRARRVLYAYMKKERADRLVEVAALTNKTFSNFLSGQCVEAVLLGTLFFLVLTIFKMPFAPVISFFIAVTALIPYVGAFLGCILGALLIVTVSPGKALAFIVIFLVVQQMENQLIYPKVVGTSVGLSPMWILVSVFVGGKLFGLLGMMFFIPVASVCNTLARLNVEERLKKRNLEVDDDGVRPIRQEE